MSKLKSLYDGAYWYQTSPTWTFGFEDDEHQFGILYEVIDMYGATGEDEFEHYPYVVSASIMAHRCHADFNESGDDKPSLDSLRLDANSYCGGVPIDHILQDGIDGGFDQLASQFSIDEACVVSHKHNYGTVAAQRGRGTEHKSIRFKTEDAAQRFIKLLADRAKGTMGFLIGFTLDKPINMLGETGWETMRTQVFGYKNKQRA